MSTPADPKDIPSTPQPSHRELTETHRVKAIREQVQGLSTTEEQKAASLAEASDVSEAGSEPDQAMTPVTGALDIQEQAGDRSLADIGDGDDMLLGESAANTATRVDGIDDTTALQTPAKPSSAASSVSV